MITFLFWNLNKKPLQDIITELAKTYYIDVLMFAECSIEPGELLSTLNEVDDAEFYYAPSIGCEKIEIFTRFNDSFLKLEHESDRLTIRHLELPGLTSILLAVSHFQSKIHWDDMSQSIQCLELSRSITDAENKVGHSRTVLVGDMNMNPFEDGVVSAAGLHAVMSRRIAEKEGRVVGGKKYPFFYNPMWSFFGDISPTPPGTYYYSKSRHKEYFWHIFDQVLIRPALLNEFSSEDLRIIESVRERSFLNSSGTPQISDHLPILFKLKL